MTKVFNSRKFNLYLHEYCCYIDMYTMHETKKKKQAANKSTLKTKRFKIKFVIHRRKR